jgi:hypothetical protein
MKNLIILYAILILIILGIVIFTYASFPFNKKRGSKSDKRRRWGRIKIPEGKTMTCRITEPAALASTKDYSIDDINMGGIAFFSDKQLEKKNVRLAIRFPFASYQEAGLVKGKIVYCTEVKPKQFRVGIAFIREKKK